VKTTAPAGIVRQPVGRLPDVLFFSAPIVSQALNPAIAPVLLHKTTAYRRYPTGKLVD
jgi:hypothetical protein